MSENPMRNIEIERIVLHISVGEAGERLRKAERVIDVLTSRKPIYTLAKKTIKDFNIRKNLPMGLKVTLRGPEAEEFLKKALWVKGFKLPSYAFDNTGDLHFGIPDYTEFEGVRYDPDIGIFGFDVNVVFKRSGGWRLKYRKLKKARMGASHRLTPAETKNYIKEKFNVEIVEVD